MFVHCILPASIPPFSSKRVQHSRFVACARHTGAHTPAHAPQPPHPPNPMRGLHLGPLAVLLLHAALPAAPQTLTRYPLAAATALCNDGSPAVYYSDVPLPAGGGARFLVWLQGGSLCFDNATCQARTARPGITSSTTLPATLTADTVFLPDPAQNPAFHAHIHVFLPYCSSDLWQGSRADAGADVTGFRFCGDHIVSAVVREALAPSDPAEVVVAGESAGGAGALGQANRIAAGLPNAAVTVYADSAWNVFNERTAAVLSAAYALWNATFDPACTAARSAAPWLCAMASVVADHVPLPVLFAIPMYDPVETFGPEVFAAPPAINETTNRLISFTGGGSFSPSPLHPFVCGSFPAPLPHAFIGGPPSLLLSPGGARATLYQAGLPRQAAPNRSYYSPACFWHVLTRPVTELEYATYTDSLAVYTTNAVNGTVLNQALAAWARAPATPAAYLDAVADVSAYNPHCPALPLRDAEVTLVISKWFALIPTLLVLASLPAYGWCMWHNRHLRREADRFKADRDGGGVSTFDVPKTAVEIESKDVVYRTKVCRPAPGPVARPEAADPKHGPKA